MLTNSIVWGNEAAQIGIREGHGEPTPIVTYSDIQGGDPDNPGQPWPGEGNIDADPVFVEDDCGISGFALGQNSPCIDAAITAGAPAVDICGISRPQDMGGPSETLTDMGAYEYPASTVDILKAVYDYVNDALEVHASSPNGQDAALELIGYGPMEWDKKKSLWKKTVSEAIVPLSITVCGPLDGCATVY